MPKACIQPRSTSTSSGPSRSREEVITDIRSRLAMLPAAVNVGQPISHRLDHMLSGVRAQIALKIFGDDLDTLRNLAEQLAEPHGRHQGPRRSAGRTAGAHPAGAGRRRLPESRRCSASRPSHVTEALETLLNGRVVSQIIDGNRRYDVVLRVADADRTTEGLSKLHGRDAGRPRAALLVRAGRRHGRPQPDPARQHAPAHRRACQHRRLGHGPDHRPTSGGSSSETRCRSGYSTTLEGTFQAQEEAVAADRAAVAGVARRHLHRALQPLPIGGAVAHHHGQHPAGADRQRHRPVARGAAALGRHHDRLHHAGRHQRAQRHPQDQPLHQPGAARRRDVRARR